MTWTQAVDRFLDFWNDYRGEGPWHPCDTDWKKKKLGKINVRNMKEYEKYKKKGGGKIVKNVGPVPFTGNLYKARLVILLLNPGFGPQSIHECGKFSEFAGEKWNNRQINEGISFLDDEMAKLSPGGFSWWNAAILPHAARLSYEEDMSISCVREKIKNRMACLDLIPYRSKLSPSSKKTLLKQESSVQAACLGRVAVEKSLKENSEIKVILHYGSGDWEDQIGCNRGELEEFKVHSGSNAQAVQLHRSEKFYVCLRNLLQD